MFNQVLPSGQPMLDIIKLTKNVLQLLTRSAFVKSHFFKAKRIIKKSAITKPSVKSSFALLFTTQMT